MGSLLTFTYLAPIGVDHVEPVEWNDEPFTNLVLAGGQKELVQALVETHYSTESTAGGASYARFDDFVQGKGQGLVINLYGNPGVGKTLTAEAMSERTSSDKNFTESSLTTLYRKQTCENHCW